MIETAIVQGRRIGPDELEQIRQLLAEHPDWSRHRISQHLALQWDWRNGTGQLKDMAARTLLLKLERRGSIVLPPRRSVPPNRMRPAQPQQMQMDGLELAAPQTPIAETLGALLPLTLSECSQARKAAAGPRALFNALLRQHHYLSHSGTVGENLQYLVSDIQGRPLACVLFGAAAWQCADRDRHIGWESAARAQNLHFIANNTRFLILPWVAVPHLASHVLSRIARRLSGDWQSKYGHPIYLLETFVQRDRFSGASYQAANWLSVGQTKGRTRQDSPDGKQLQAPIKDIYLYPLHPHFAQRLRQANPPASPPGTNLHDYQ
jgi:hypothetical protein